MTSPAAHRFAAMPWTELVDRLDTAAHARRTTGPDHHALEDYFGGAELRVLIAMSRRARAARRRSGHDRPVVIFLPGIMGSSLLAVRQGLSPDLVWVDYFGLAAGHMERLRLAPDGRREADPAYRVHSISVDKRAYARLVVALGGAWDVQPLAYDWRKDLDLAADQLAARIHTDFAGRPVHLVAHSMGGLVARRFLQRHERLWRGLETGGSGGRLVMLGTPNYGSYDILRALGGELPLLRLLAAFDLKHTLSELQQILAGFPGIYQMLPHPSSLGEAAAIYRAAAWGEHPVSAAHLRRAREFHLSLAEPADGDARRMAYIAGCNQPTFSGVHIAAPGRFTYSTTLAGDGRVPHSLGLLAGVDTYFAEEAHGRLSRSLDVIQAVDQILATGRATALAQAPPHAPRRPGTTTGAASPRHKTFRPPATPAQVRRAEEELMQAAMETIAETAGAVRRPAAGTRQPLVIEVVQGDIATARAPVAVVGHYQGVAPVNALGAIDRRLGGWLSEATRSSVFGGELGRLFYVPVAEKLMEAAGVLVAGMGLEGRFSATDLRYLMQTVASAVAAWKMGGFASVLIGSGEGNLPVEKALRAFVHGICDALERLPAGHTLKRILLVELDRARSRRLRALLDGMRGEFAARGVDLHVKRGPGVRQPARRAPSATRPAVLPEETFGPRLTVTRERETLRYTALTRQAVVPAREIEVQDFYLHGIAGKLVRSETIEDQRLLGRLLSTYLLPADLLEACDTGAPLTVVVDRTTASLPWEMAAVPGSAPLRFLGTDQGVARQFQTLLSPAPALGPAAGSRIRALVIADPAPGDLHLAGAAREGAEVVRLLERIRQDCHLDIDVLARIGPDQCDPIDMLALLLDGEFDVVHFAGHGIFDEARPNHSGWVFGREADGRLRTLSATEIFRARRVPRLVFSNACFSAAAAERSTALENNRALAGLAEAFFERGVPNYIGSGWAVGDDAAVSFATEFYARALAGVPAGRLRRPSRAQTLPRPPATLGQALAAARARILGDGSTWGAYQHYGDPAARLIQCRERRSHYNM